VDGEPEKRGRRVGGWDHGSMIETWKGLGGNCFVAVCSWQIW
jgi:hypothetical protein